MSFLLWSCSLCSFNHSRHGRTLVIINTCTYSKISVSSTALFYDRHLLFSPDASLNYFLVAFDDVDPNPLLTVALSRHILLFSLIWDVPPIIIILFFYFLILPLFLHHYFSPLLNPINILIGSYFSHQNKIYFEGIFFFFFYPSAAPGFFPLLLQIVFKRAVYLCFLQFFSSCSFFNTLQQTFSYVTSEKHFLSTSPVLTQWLNFILSSS